MPEEVEIRYLSRTNNASNLTIVLNHHSNSLDGTKIIFAASMFANLSLSHKKV